MTEPKVVRLDPDWNMLYMREVDLGLFVDYSDYEALAARVEGLEYSLGECRKGSAIRTQIDTKRCAEITRLREALEWIAAECELDSIEVTSLKWLRDAACAALKEKP